MDKISSEQQHQDHSRSAANQPFQDSINVRSISPPPLQLEKKEKSTNEESESESEEKEYVADGSPGDEDNNIDNAINSIQLRPPNVFDQIGANAYTQGSSIFLKSDFNINDTQDQGTLLHEVAHAVKNQNSSPSITTYINGLPVNDDPTIEKEASINAERFRQNLNSDQIKSIFYKNLGEGQSGTGPLQREENSGPSNKMEQKVQNYAKVKEHNIVYEGENTGYVDLNAISRHKALEELSLELRKDIIHIVKENVAQSEKIANASAQKHRTGSQEGLSQKGYKAFQEIKEEKSVLRSSSNSASRMGIISPGVTKRRTQAQASIKENQAILKDVAQQDPLIYIAGNMGKTELLKDLQSGGLNDTKKQHAIMEIMDLFQTYTNMTLEYARDSPFEFQPVIQQLAEGRIGPTGFNWTRDPQLLSAVVSTGSNLKLLDNLLPDVVSIVLAIAAGVFSGGMSAFLTVASIAAEGASVANTHHEMKMMKAVSMANADETLRLLSKEAASGKQVEFQLALGFLVLGVIVDGVSIAKADFTLSAKQIEAIDNADNMKISKIDKNEYNKIIGGNEGEKEYLSIDLQELKKKMLDGTVVVNKAELDKIAKQSQLSKYISSPAVKAEFAQRMPSSIRRAGGWKKLLEEVGDDLLLRAGMEQWRSDLYEKGYHLIEKTYKIKLSRTGSQAKEATIDALLAGSKSDMDISILGNRVVEVRELLVKMFSNELKCSPTQLEDYLDMSIFANTPVKAVFNTIKDKKARELLQKDQSRFEAVTIYNKMLQDAKLAKDDKLVTILEQEMKALGIEQEKIKFYKTPEERKSLQGVIDVAKRTDEGLQKQIVANMKKKAMPGISQKEVEQLDALIEKQKKQLYEAKSTAMKGTTLMDISDSESFWSHAGIMEVVFKQNADFKHLVSQDYTEAQKLVMVIHDMAQLRVKLAKVKDLGKEFVGVENVSNKLLKDISKSSSRAANALSINAIDEVLPKIGKTTAEELKESSKLLIENKKSLAGVLPPEKIDQFKDDAITALKNIEKQADQQIKAMANTDFVNDFKGQKMIADYQAQIQQKIFFQNLKEWSANAMKAIAKKGLRAGRIANKVSNHNDSNKNQKIKPTNHVQMPEVKKNIVSSSKSIAAGNSKDSIETLLKIGEILQDSGQDISDFKFDHWFRNIAPTFNKLKRISEAEGGLKSNVEIGKVFKLQKAIGNLQAHIEVSILSQKDKNAIRRITKQIHINLENLIDPPVKKTPKRNKKKTSKKRNAPKKSVNKKVLTPSLGNKKGYTTTEDSVKREKEKRKSNLKQNTTKISIMKRVGIGKYIKIEPGEWYYENGNNDFLGKKED